MRGAADPQLAMLTSLSPEDLIPVDHPIRRIRAVVDVVLAELDDVFDGMYATGGRASVPPEASLKATVLMAMYSIRSERAFCERLNYDLLFKWFLEMRIDQSAFDATTFTKNRERLLEHEVADEDGRLKIQLRSPASKSPATPSTPTVQLTSQVDALIWTCVMQDDSSRRLPRRGLRVVDPSAMEPSATRRTCMSALTAYSPRPRERPLTRSTVRALVALRSAGSCPRSFKRIKGMHNSLRSACFTPFGLGRRSPN